MIGVDLAIPPEMVRALDGTAVRARIAAALRVIQSDLITHLQEATPKSSTQMSDAWQAGVSGVRGSVATTTVRNTQPYAHYVLYGSSPASANPGGYLVPWVEKKLTLAQQYRIARGAGMSENAARTAAGRGNVKYKASSLAVAVAYIIGAARMKRGSKGNDFATPVIEENTPLYQQLLEDYVLGVFS